MVYLKLMPGIPYDEASRNKRELSAAYELGYEIIVVSSESKEREGFPNYKFICDGLTQLSYSMPRLKRYIIIFCDDIRLIKKIRNIDKNIMSCHNLKSLLFGWLSNCLLPRAKKAKLIYDSHEFELGKAAERSKIILWFIKHLERFLIKRCDFSIMVNDSIADEVQRIHKLKQRPIVVRSTPNYWTLETLKIRETRSEICKAMGVPKDTFLIMYHGGVMPHRKIEIFIDAVSRNPHIAGIILGNAFPESYLEQLKKYAKVTGVSGRIYFHPAVPIEELYKYVSAADVGTVLISARYKNDYLCLPNKFFENIQSMTPLITFEFPEMKHIIQQYGIGLTVDTLHTDDIDSAIERMRTDREFYTRCKKNLEAAKRELCWENEKQVLLRALQ